MQVWEIRLEFFNIYSKEDEEVLAETRKLIDEFDIKLTKLGFPPYRMETNKQKDE